MGSLVKYLKTLIILSVLLIIPCIAKSEVIETWQCTEPNSTEIIFIAQVNEGGETGQIKVASITNDAFVHGGDFYRRWDFGLNERSTMYNYALVIKSDGKGLYFDFTQGYTIEPSQRLKCKNK
jgi:hypothetical protein